MLCVSLPWTGVVTKVACLMTKEAGTHKARTPSVHKLYPQRAKEETNLLLSKGPCQSELRSEVRKGTQRTPNICVGSGCTRCLDKW